VTAASFWFCLSFFQFVSESSVIHAVIAQALMFFLLFLFPFSEFSQPSFSVLTILEKNDPKTGSLTSVVIQ
jgi:hypothetical protein